MMTSLPASGAAAKLSQETALSMVHQVSVQVGLAAGFPGVLPQGYTVEWERCEKFTQDILR